MGRTQSYRVQEQQARVAGLLHDLGKVRVPEEVLEKPGSLTREEFDLIKEHTFYTYRILRAAGDLSPLAEWAAYHYERLEGQGYPFRLKGEQLDLGTRLLAVADVFAALKEDRPYRPGLPKSEIVAPLRKQVASGALDPEVVERAVEAYEDLEEAVRLAERQAIFGKAHQE